MAQIITNQASLNFQYNGQSGTAVSNLATAVIDDPFTVDKNSVTETYRAGEALTYTVSIVNNGASAQNDITVSDDLGAFTPGTFPIVPLDYLPPALLYINGESQGTLTGDVGEDGVTFTIPSLAAGANALIVYRAIPPQELSP
jgi:uncharacterized repeat protein (TIGR01451 family)